VLQSHGEEVGPAWPIVLALIKGVAQDEEEQHVRQAFMCVQLVRNDLLSVLPVDCLQLLLTTIGSYGCQGIDQHTATHCNTLQQTATHYNKLQHTATHYNTLQDTAIKCNKLQHSSSLPPLSPMAVRVCV